METDFLPSNLPTVCPAIVGTWNRMISDSFLPAAGSPRSVASCMIEFGKCPKNCASCGYAKDAHQRARLSLMEATGIEYNTEYDIDHRSIRTFPRNGQGGCEIEHRYSNGGLQPSRSITFSVSPSPDSARCGGS